MWQYVAKEKRPVGPLGDLYWIRTNDLLPVKEAL